MRPVTLLLRNLAHYRRTHLAVLAGVAVAGAAVGGALIVGDSVRGSLRDLTTRRLGRVDCALQSPRFLRAEIAAGLNAEGAAAVGLIRMTGSVVRDADKARVGRVEVDGVGDDFWKLMETAAPELKSDEAALNAELAGELGAELGDVVLVRIERVGDVPREAVFGRRAFADTVRELRLRVGAIVPSDRGVGRFSLAGGAPTPRTVFVALSTLQSRLGRPGRVNTILVDAVAAEHDVPSAGGSEPSAHEAARARLQTALHAAVRPDDLGLHVRIDAKRGLLSVETPRLLLDSVAVRAIERAAAEVGLRPVPVLTHLANSISSGGKSVPYSTVTAVSPVAAGLRLVDGSPAPEPAEDELLLNEWAAADLGVAAGAEVELTYYLEGERGVLRTESRKFRLRGVVALADAAADPGFAPSYPGITDRTRFADWDPPFPVDLKRIRKKDEDYWDRHRATPKVFVNLAVGRRLWGGRFGDLTAIRLYPAGRLAEAATALSTAIPRHLTAEQTGLVIRPVMAEGLAAAAGATDFGELFLGFSSFLIIAAALLVGLLYRLGVEQRLREIGLLTATGMTGKGVRRLLAAEGLLTATVGGPAGAAAAAGYAWLMLAGLRGWWADAVGGTPLELHISRTSIAAAAGAGPVLAFVSIAWALFGLRRATPRALLGGIEGVDAEASAGLRQRRGSPGRWARWTAALAGLAAVGLTAASFTRSGEAAAGLFFGAGACLLTAALALLAARLRSADRGGKFVRSLLGLAGRNAARRPARSVLTAGLTASAAFVIISVEAFRQDPARDATLKDSGAGGFALIAETDLPVLHDLNTPAGRGELNLPVEAEPLLSQTKFFGLRLRPGDDASCRNLYRPDEPRVLGVPPELIERGGFAFAGVAGSLDLPREAVERPWRTLTARPETAGESFAVGDANTVRWILHKSLGGTIDLRTDAGEPATLRIAATLSHSIFQSELLIAESDFVRLFPTRAGRRVFLIEPPPGRADEVKRVLNEHLAELGVYVESTAERLAAFSAVENAYLSTFQALGSLGLLLGTAGLTAVMLRNVLERRGELALLRALGFRRSALAALVMLENGLLLAAGLGIGVLSALLAVTPQLLSAAGSIPIGSLAAMMGVIAAAGTAAGAAAIPAVLRAPLLTALRSE